MTGRVPADQIEGLVGAARHPVRHIARAVSAEQTVYLMHPDDCREGRADLTTCPHSIALYAGIRAPEWDRHEDRPVYAVVVVDDTGYRLAPACALIDDRMTPRCEVRA